MAASASPVSYLTSTISDCNKTYPFGMPSLHLYTELYQDWGTLSSSCQFLSFQVDNRLRFWYTEVTKAIKAIQNETERGIQMQGVETSETESLTVAEVAERIGRCNLTIRRWITSGKLKASRVGRYGQFMIDPKDLEKCLEYKPKKRDKTNGGA